MHLKLITANILTFPGLSFSDHFHFNASIFRQQHALQVYHSSVAVASEWIIPGDPTLEILAMTHKSLRQLVENGPCVFLRERGGETIGYLL